MKVEDKISSKIIEYEIQIKLLDYLKENKDIDDGMYQYVIGRLINKISLLEKS